MAGLRAGYCAYALASQQAPTIQREAKAAIDGAPLSSAAKSR
jgi:hypothetical protein